MFQVCNLLKKCISHCGKIWLIRLYYVRDIKKHLFTKKSKVYEAVMQFSGSMTGEDKKRKGLAHLSF